MHTMKVESKYLTNFMKFIIASIKARTFFHTEADRLRSRMILYDRRVQKKNKQTNKPAAYVIWSVTCTKQRRPIMKEV